MSNYFLIYKAMNMTGKNIAIISAIGVFLFLGVFYVGMRYERISVKVEKVMNLREGGVARQGMRASGERNVSPQAGFVVREVIAKDDNSITVKNKKGGSKLFII